MGDALTTTAARLSAIGPRRLGDVLAHPERIAALSGGMQVNLAQLESFLLEKVYQHPTVAQAMAQAKTELGALFEAYLADPARLPGRYVERMDEQGAHRVICDYLAGMTDRFCHELYEEL